MLKITKKILSMTYEIPCFLVFGILAFPIFWTLYGVNISSKWAMPKVLAAGEGILNHIRKVREWEKT